MRINETLFSFKVKYRVYVQSVDYIKNSLRETDVQVGTFALQTGFAY